MCETTMFCAVKVGRNTCGICYEDAFFSHLIPQRSHHALADMQLLSCGHGMCHSCWEQLTQSSLSSGFKCPFCRTEGTNVANFNYAAFLSLEARGIICAEEVPAPMKSISTFSEFLEEWEERLYLLSKSKHPFMLLHKQIIYEEEQRKAKVNAEKEKRQIKAVRLHKKQTRKKSRQKAVCHICKKDTFTSEKQLNVHINAKHSK